MVAGLLFVNKVGAGPFAGLTITANLLRSVLVDQFGLFGMPVHLLNPWRILGGALMAGGIALFCIRAAADRTHAATQMYRPGLKRPGRPVLVESTASRAYSLWCRASAPATIDFPVSQADIKQHSRRIMCHGLGQYRSILCCPYCT